MPMLLSGGLADQIRLDIYLTYHSILNAKPELVFGIGSLDFNFHNWWAWYHSELHNCLVLRILCK